MIIFYQLQVFLSVTSINIMHNIDGESSPEEAVDGAKPGAVGKGMKKSSVPHTHVLCKS